MKFLKNKAKKALMAAVTMSLVMGAYGTASAANLYGAGGSGESISGVTPDKAATTFQEKATASGNEFTISAGTVSGDIYGGRTDNGYALNNQVSISGGNIGYDASGDPILGKGSIYGGYTENGLAQGNTVTISQAEGKTTQINGNVYGGYTEWFGTGDANNNIVNVSGGEMSFVGGGYTLNGSAVGNHVNVTGGKMLWVYGGFSGFSGLYGTATETLYASSNIVEISGAATEVANHVSGGSIRDGNAINNVAIVNGGTIGADVFGGEVINQGDATGNTVNISGGKIGRAVYGGYTEEGAATGNTVSISAGSIGGDVYGGKVGYYNKEHGEGDAVGNSVNITGSSITGDVYGGQTEKGAANGNKVGTSATNAATNFTAAGVCGGLGITGAASNEVWLGEGAEVAGSVYGGYTKDGTAGVTGTVEGNIVSIKGAGTSATERVQINGSVYGGNSENGAANGNKVGYMNGTTFGAATNFTVAGVYGGLGITGAASNEVWLGEGAEVARYVVGGCAWQGDATSNSVTISGGEIVNSSKFVYGGYAVNGNATSNTVTIEGGTISSAVIGGHDYGVADSGKVTDGNKVTITGGTINNAVYGGSSNNNNALNNSVEIDGSTTKITGNVYGGFSGADNVEENTVTISGGTITGNVYGGKSADGTANDNVVNISGTADISTAEVYGGKGTFAGTGNTLNIDTWTGSKTMKSINDFQIINVIDTKEIEAGSADGLADGTVALDIQYANLATEVAALKATDKIVFINTNGSDDFFKKFSTAKLNGINKGEGIWSAKTTGFGVDASRAEFKIDTKKAFVGVTDVVLAGIFVDDKGNTTSQDLVLEARAKDYENIYGAYNAKNEAMAAIVNLNTAADLSKSTIYGNNVSAAGNTLNVKATGVKVKALKNFENMNFYIPADAKAGDTMVDVQEAVDLNKVNVAAGFHNDTTLTYGDKVKLINAPAVSGVNGVVETKVDDTDYTKYDVNIYQGDAGMNETASGATSLVAELVNSELTENAKSLVETMAAGTAILADSSDMLASAGFANAESALRADVEQGAPSGSMSIFGAVNGNKSRVKSGSYVDVKGWNFNMGAAKELVSKSGKLIFAPVVEYGRGSYDSYLNNGYHGEGKTEYVGGGLMAKKLNKGGSYVEGSVRAGKLSADYEATGGNYDSDSMYLAAHLGLGKVVKLSEKNSLDYYGKYFYSRQGSDDTTVNANGKNLDLHFDAVESHRTRLGGRFNHALGETNTVYAGLAWQHEFSSTARATLDGMGTPSPSMKGDTGILELGVKVSEADKYDLDFGVNGSIGKKKGAGLSLNFNWKF